MKTIHLLANNNIAYRAAGVVRICLMVFGLFSLGIFTIRAADHYVRPPETCTNTDLQSPFTSWDTAATNIKQAVTVTTNGETIWVTNGIYTNWSQISISKGFTLKSVNGANLTVIDGNYSAITQGCITLNHRDAVIDGFTIRNGHANYFGGGVAIYSDGGTVRNCIITSNTSDGTGYGGGGIFITMTGTVENCVVSKNYTIGNAPGAGIYIYYTASSDNVAKVLNCTISENTTSNAHAGGIYFYMKGLARSCLIVNNVSGGNNVGGGAYLDRGGVLQNCTVVSNYAGNSGGGIYLTSTTGTGTVLNTVLYLNYAAGGSPGRSNYWHDPIGIYSNCCLSPALSGDSTNVSANNITNNPQFISAEYQNYRLASGSPCINRGANADWMAGALDLDGHRRKDFFSRQVDIGAYEYVPRGTVFVVK